MINNPEKSASLILKITENDADKIILYPKKDNTAWLALIKPI